MIDKHTLVHILWFVCGGGLGFLGGFFIYSLCSISSQADRTNEQIAAWLEVQGGEELEHAEDAWD